MTSGFPLRRSRRKRKNNRSWKKTVASASGTLTNDDSYLVEGRKPGDNREGLRRAYVEFGVLRTEVLRHRFCVSGFVVFRLIEPDRERPHRTIALLLHQGNDQR